ncbi:hypothetical protein ALC60_11526 [Trachymyrmex zeteki]|uniref:Uncharacterized protein n=1 Tax=Mycetomoellerius zeteki TaxID=64791 RepID=A0A151WNM1_9HYME|nr:hypothetical protein ALC60_11526 [Trachymyrmex zeteki]
MILNLIKSIILGTKNILSTFSKTLNSTSDFIVRAMQQPVSVTRESCWPPGRIAEGRPRRGPPCPPRGVWLPATFEWRSRILPCTRAPCYDPLNLDDRSIVLVAYSKNPEPDPPLATPRFGTNPYNRVRRSNETASVHLKLHHHIKRLLKTYSLSLHWAALKLSLLLLSNIKYVFV